MPNQRKLALLVLMPALLLALVPMEAEGKGIKGKALAIKDRISAIKDQAPHCQEISDFDELLRSRDPIRLIESLNENMRRQVNDQWDPLIMKASGLAYGRNKSELYPNPAIQAYVNRLGQSLIPRDTPRSIQVTFRVIEDPLPFADALATGSIYLSTGLISLLDNESQLAFLLMHEAGHVLLSHHLCEIIQNEKAEKRGDRIALIGSAASIVAGGLIGGSSGGERAFQGTALAYLGSKLVSRFQRWRFTRVLQKESDRFAAEVLLSRGFDAREAPILMAKIGEVVRRSNAAVGLAFGYSKDLPARVSKVSDLLNGSYKPTVDRILHGEGFQMASPRFAQIMADLKRDNGIAALERDLFTIARTNLEEAAAVRSDDPLTLYGLGMLYRTVGRTEEELSLAASYLRSCAQFDEGRFRFPDAYLQYSVELMSREDPRLYPEIQATLKKYVALHSEGEGRAIPKEMRFIYDSLDMTGDRSWSAFQGEGASITGLPASEADLGPQREARQP